MIIVFIVINVSYCQSFFHIKWKLKQQIMKEAEKINISKYFYITHFGFLQTFSTSILITDRHSAFFYLTGQDWAGHIEKWLIMENKRLLTKNIPERLAFFFQRK